MALPDYQLACYHPSTGVLLDVIDNRRIQRLQYSKRLKDAGRFTVTLAYGDPIAQYAGLKDMIVDIYRTNTTALELEETYFLRYSQFNRTNQDTLILGGEACIGLFAKRLVVPEDDPLQANGFSTKSGIADNVMLSYVDEQIISPATNAFRAQSQFSTAPSQNLGQPVFYRAQYEPLLTVLQTLAVQGRVDFSLTHTSANLFEFAAEYVGANKSKTANYPFSRFVYFSPLRGNLKNPAIVVNAYDETNAIFMQSQGIEEDRITTLFDSQDVYDSPFARREKTADAREIEDNGSLLDGLTTSANKAILDNQAKISFEFEVQVGASGAAYNVDWMLGDTVTANYEDIGYDMRVTQVELDITGTTQTIKPTLERQVI